MTSQPPQDEVEEVARALNELERDNFGTFSWEALDEMEREGFREEAQVAIATIDRLRRATPAEGKDNSVAAGAAPLDARHTPGPWKARQEFRNRWRIESHANGPEFIPVSVALVSSAILEMGCNDESTPANALLIEAAPDLLAALQEAERFLDYFTNGRTSFVGGGTPRFALEQVRAAIAKATAPVDEAAEPVRSETKASEPAPLPTPPKEESHG